MFAARVRTTCFDGDENWRELRGRRQRALCVGSRARSTSRSRRTSTECRQRPAPLDDIRGARALAVLGDSVTTDHISPAGNIAQDQPRGEVSDGARHRAGGFQLVRRAARQSRSDGARHVRQRAPAERARRRASKAASRATCRRASEMSIFDAAMQLQRRRHAADRPRRKRVWLGFVARLGRQGPVPARNQGGDRRVVRAHSSQQPDRHGRPAARVRRRRRSLDLRPHRRRDFRRSTASRAASHRRCARG